MGISNSQFTYKLGIILILTILLLTPVGAQDDFPEVQMEYTTGLDVGESLEYSVSIDDTFDVEANFPFSQQGIADGDILKFELNGGIDQTFVSLLETHTIEGIAFYTVWTIEAKLEGQTSPPFTYVIDLFDSTNGGEVQEARFLPIWPTIIRYDDCTFSEAESILISAVGYSANVTYSISDGNIDITNNIVRVVENNVVIDITTGIMRSYTVGDEDGEGAITYTLLTDVPLGSTTSAIGSMCDLEINEISDNTGTETSDDSDSPLAIFGAALAFIALTNLRRKN